jgi:hypothetical protein
MEGVKRLEIGEVSYQIWKKFPISTLERGEEEFLVRNWNG